MRESAHYPGLKSLAHLVLGSAVLVIVFSGCATLPRNAVPLDKIYDTEIPGLDGARAWGGEFNPEFQADIIQSLRDERRGEFPLDERGTPIHHGLALSGGGSNGAFGAGLLIGWSETGTRPDFKLVTGISTGALIAPISTGALIAPLAFLGATYDDELKEVFTTTTTANIMERLNVFTILFRSESIARTDPLERLVEQHISEETLRAVADKHDRGYRLYIGTTNLDAQRLMVWNMGVIAKWQSPQALQLFRKVMVASASIPAAFPPVLVDVEIDGRAYDEMHADGGVTTQVFFYGGIANIAAARREVHGDEAWATGSQLYVIRNGQIRPDAQLVKRNLGQISARAINTMIKSAALADLYRIFSFTRRDGIGFQYTDIPDDYVAHSEELFDQVEMNRLFKVGYELATSGEPWSSLPPGFEAMEIDR
jgi:hypothetical protein